MTDVSLFYHFSRPAFIFGLISVSSFRSDIPFPLDSSTNVIPVWRVFRRVLDYVRRVSLDWAASIMFLSRVHYRPISPLFRYQCYTNAIQTPMKGITRWVVFWIEYSWMWAPTANFHYARFKVEGTCRLRVKVKVCTSVFYLTIKRVFLTEHSESWFNVWFWSQILAQVSVLLIKVDV